MTVLHLPTFPLDSLALIEASAGTGKTYALANLYLRYLLERSLTVEQILVVTFTEAATQELKDRIRARIHSLLEVFDGRPASDETEQHLFLRAQIQAIDPEADRLHLKLAERQLDQAEIHTIHGFCQRLLRLHALESRVPLQQTLIEDQRPLLQQVLEDFWRGQVLTLERAEIEFIAQHWAGPAQLMTALLPLLRRPPEHLVPAPEGVGLALWRESFERTRQWFAVLQAETLRAIDQVIEVVAQSDLKALNHKLNWLQQVRAWSEQDLSSFNFPSTSSKPNLFEEFLPTKLAEQTKAKGVTPQHRYFEFLEHHLAQPLAPLQQKFLVQCFQLAHQSLQQRKQAQGLFGFDDLITQVARALGLNSALKPHHERFAEAVRKRYRVALIDEFQDTDQAQYHIFSTLFGPKAGASASRLVLIGDPKQAIYAFRGGDIATYLSAKRELSAHPRGEQFSMDTNWRSAPSMIAAVNCLFAAMPQPFMAPDIPFQPVTAGKPDSSAAPGAALAISQLDCAGLSKDQILDGLAQLCVAQVKQLLAESSGECFNNADIALLVRSGREGELLKARLAEAGINSSYEGKSSIFATPEALALYFLLQAVADPRDEYAIWRCLTETLFGFTDRQFKALNQQARSMNELLSIFDYLHRRWLRAGPLAMIREALSCLKVFDYWHEASGSAGTPLAGTAWERSLTNINQLAELLQRQARTTRGHFALLRWFHDQIVQADSADDESRLRLESDEQLIRIVTIHKSKGLEYPVVLLPFLFSCRLADEAWFYDPQGRLTLDLLHSDENLLKADAERLAEDMRLLYVALTRAKYRCYIGTCAYQSKLKVSAGLAQSAWGYLLFKGHCPEALDDDVLASQLEHWQQQAQGVLEVARLSLEQAASLAVLTSGAGLVAAPSDSQILQNRVLQRTIAHRWKVQSFTGLMHEAMAQRVAPSYQEAAGALMSELQLPRRSHQAIDILTFPKGSRAGTFLHSLFERVEFATALPIESLRQQFPTLEQMIGQQLRLSKLVEPRLIGQWTSYLASWLRSVLNYRLLPQCALADLEQQDYVSEMAFHFPVSHLEAGSFNELLRRFGYDQPALEFSAFEGHFKGAIDLLFRADGQFYVLDYKSNYLGDLADAYLPEQLQRAMDDHRYDLQYLIYCLAVHRFLSHRLGDGYCYQRDFGGVIYLFLRGLVLPGKALPGKMPPGSMLDGHSAAQPGVYFCKPDEALIEALDREVART